MNPIKKFYVSCNGNDENSGSNQSESFRTIQKAIDASYQIIGDVQIIVADGKYTNTNAIASGCRQGNLEIIGNISSPDKVVIDSGNDSKSAATFWVVNGANVAFSGMKISASTNKPPLLASCIRSTYNGLITIKGKVIFGKACYAQILVGNARVIINSGYDICGSAQYHLFCSTSSSIATTSDSEMNVKILENISYEKAFACVQTLSVINWRLPFVLNGFNVSGIRHIISDGGAVAMKALGSNKEITPDQFPGSKNGKNISGFFNGQIYGRKRWF